MKPSSSNNSAIITPAPKVLDDDHPINPKLFKEKMHFQQALKAHSPKNDEEQIFAPSGTKTVKRYALNSMNSFILNDSSSSINSILELSKKRPNNQTNSVIPPTAKPNNEHEDSSQISSANKSKKKISCNCKKSKCLKLYCDCFTAGEVCGPDCNCCDCHNSINHINERNAVRDAILERNPSAFKSKIKKDAEAIEVNFV